MECLARATHACVCTQFLQRRKARHATHRTAQMERNEPFGKMDEVLQKLFSGKGFCKTSANVFEIRRGSEFGFPRGGGVWGGIRAGILFGKFLS